MDSQMKLSENRQQDKHRLPLQTTNCDCNATVVISILIFSILVFFKIYIFQYWYFSILVFFKIDIFQY